MPNAFQRGGSDSASIVLLGSEYEPLAATADRIMERLREHPNFLRPRMNYEPTSPRVMVDIDRERAAALGVSVQAIGRTLEATMGARRRLSHQLHVAHVGDVGGEAFGRSALAAKLVGAGFGLGEVARDDEDLAAAAGKYSRDAFADAFASAGNNHGPACDGREH